MIDLHFLRTEKNKFITCVVVSWIAIFVLCLLFPYTGDDWAWGSSIGAERLGGGFVDYNGRYFGNIIVLVLTRSYLLRSLVVSLTLVGISLLVVRLTGRWRISTYLIITIFVLRVPAIMAAQTYVWTSGYANYVSTALLVLIYLNCSIDLLQDRPKNEKVINVVFMFLLGIACALILETVTIMSVCFGIAFFAYCKKRHGYWSKYQLSFLVGAILGAIVMFSNGAYWKTLTGMSDYQQLPSSPITHIFETLTTTIPNLLVMKSWLILLVISLCLIYGWTQRGKNVPISEIVSSKSYLILTVSFLWALICSLVCNFIVTVIPDNVWYALATSAMIFILVGLLAFGFSQRKTNYGRKWITVTLAIIVLVAPLTVVEPMGPRNFFLPYVLESVFACLLWDLFVEKDTSLIVLMLAGVVLISYCHLIQVFVDVYVAESNRLDTIRTAVQEGKESVSVKSLPHGEYLWYPNPVEGAWEDRYKLFYEIPEEFNIDY